MQKIALFILCASFISGCGDAGGVESLAAVNSDRIDMVKETKSANFLYAMSTDSGSFAKLSGTNYRFTMNYATESFSSIKYLQKSPPIFVFTDRPFRASGHMTAYQFLSFWETGKTFDKITPNAQIAYKNKSSGDQTTVTVALENPKFNASSGAISFEVSINPGGGGIDAGDIENIKLFIDPYFHMPWHRCGRDQYHGRFGMCWPVPKPKPVPVSSSAEKRFLGDLDTTVNNLLAAANVARSSGVDGSETFYFVIKDAADRLKQGTDKSKLQRNVGWAFLLAKQDEASLSIVESIRWLYTQEKCFILDDAMAITRNVEQVFDKIISEGPAKKSSFSDLIANENSASTNEAFQSLMNQLVKAAGGHSANSDCISDAKDFTYRGVAEFDSYNALAGEIFRQIVLAKGVCHERFDSCYK